MPECENKNAVILIKVIELWLLNQLFIQKVFIKCSTCSRQHVGHSAYQGKIARHKVGEIRREKF